MISKANALSTLSSFIDHNSPKLATFLARQWSQQQNAITYRELREAIFAGQLDMQYLTQWQQDYSDFVATYYAPLAEKAIKNAAANLATAYGGALIDPLSTTVDSFIKTQGGKLIKEISTAQFNAINTLVRQASLSETMTVDQLARSIRPCVGLTQRQAQAVKNYYDSMIAQGYSPAEATKRQAVYAERMHRRRAATIAQTEMAYAYNYGMDAVVRDNIKNGVYEQGVTKRWRTAYDENVCDICGGIDGEEIDINKPFSNGYMLPPGHPNCRCAASYHNIKLIQQSPTQPATTTQTPPPSTTTTQSQPDPTYQQPNIADAPKLDNLQYVSSKQMGTGEMHQYKDASGKEWIFKPAQTKKGNPEKFRGYVQEAGYKVQSIIDPDSAVPCRAVTLTTPNGTKFGAAQLTIKNTDSSFDLKAWQMGAGSNPTADVIVQLQRESVTDWLLCNYDSHGGNFLSEKHTGRVIGVDKEQAFRYISKPSAQKMSYSFHPNSIYRETEPIYNTLYRKFAYGEIDISLNDTLTYIKRIEAVPDEEYREIFRSYAEALHGKGIEAEQLLDKIVSRKQNARATFESFYTEILTERKGKPTAFQFIDSLSNAVDQQMQTTAMTSKALSGMSLSDLKSLAKQKGIKYAWNMNKAQLIDAISDPGKTAQIVQDAKNRAYGIGTKPKVPKSSETYDGKINGVMRLTDAFNDIDGILANSTPRGVALISDATSLEGLATNLRKVDIDGQTYYELSGKMTESKWMDAMTNFNAQSGNNWHFNVARGSIDYTKPILELSSSTSTYGIQTKYIRNGDDILIISGSDAKYSGRALMGQFNIRVQASNGTDAANKIKALIQQAGISDIADDVTEAAINRYKKMRLIWQTDPKLAGRLDAVRSSDAEIDKALKKLGITEQRLDKVEVRMVQDGYFTLYDPENIKLANKYKVAYLYHEAATADAAVSIMQSGELLATTNRWGRGIVKNGASSNTDIGTGGADSVFTRIVFDNQVGKERRYSYFGDYVFIFDKKALERTDWYAYTDDRFGTTEVGEFSGRYGTEAHFSASRKRYSRSNELMFRKTLPLDTLMEIRVPHGQRQDMIDRLKQAGITKHNGIKVEDFIKEGDDRV